MNYQNVYIHTGFSLYYNKTRIYTAKSMVIGLKQSYDCFNECKDIAAHLVGTTTAKESDFIIKGINVEMVQLPLDVYNDLKNDGLFALIGKSPKNLKERAYKAISEKWVPFQDYDTTIRKWELAIYSSSESLSTLGSVRSNRRYPVKRDKPKKYIVPETIVNQEERNHFDRVKNAIQSGHPIKDVIELARGYYRYASRRKAMKLVQVLSK
jgi:hypothetical protein